MGSFDPFPNENNEKLVALNLERIQHYLAGGIRVSKPVAQLLGQDFVFDCLLDPFVPISRGSLFREIQGLVGYLCARVYIRRQSLAHTQKMQLDHPVARQLDYLQT